MTMTPQQFNDAYPLGTLVRYWPGGRTGPGRVAVTRTPAWQMNTHDVVVSVTGYAGGIALTHVEPVIARVRYEAADGNPTVWWAECTRCADFTGSRHENVRYAIVDADDHRRSSHPDTDDDYVTVECDGSDTCPTETHAHGCYADTGSCDAPREHESVKAERGTL